MDWDARHGWTGELPAVLARAVTGWALYVFACPVEGCGYQVELADHDRRDPATFDAYACAQHAASLTYIGKRVLLDVARALPRSLLPPEYDLLLPRWSLEVMVDDLTIGQVDEGGWHRVTALVKTRGSDSGRPQDAPRRALCPACDGTGEDHSRHDGACTACDGTGNGQECPKCGGWMPPWRFADECQGCAWGRAGAA